MNVWKRREHLDAGQSVKAYLYRSVHNLSLNKLQRMKIVRDCEEYIESTMPDVITPDQALEQSEISDAVNNAVNSLPEKCREIFLMNRTDGLTYSEIAEVLNVSINTVKTQMGRALKSIRKNLSGFLSLFF